MEHQRASGHTANFSQPVPVDDGVVFGLQMQVTHGNGEGVDVGFGGKDPRFVQGRAFAGRAALIANRADLRLDADPAGLRGGSHRPRQGDVLFERQGAAVDHDAGKSSLQRGFALVQPPTVVEVRHHWHRGTGRQLPEHFPPEAHGHIRARARSGREDHRRADRFARRRVSPGVFPALTDEAKARRLAGVGELKDGLEGGERHYLNLAIMSLMPGMVST